MAHIHNISASTSSIKVFFHNFSYFSNSTFFLIWTFLLIFFYLSLKISYNKNQRNLIWKVSKKALNIYYKVQIVLSSVHNCIQLWGTRGHLFDFATLCSILDSQLSWGSGKFQLARWSHEVQGVPQYCSHFCFVNFSASKASRNSILDIFQQPFSCRFKNYPICY